MTANLDWGVFAAVFLAASVEWVEAFTIVLAVGITAGWRIALFAACWALLLLGAFALSGGGLLLLGAHIGWLRGVIGVFLILFGLRWLAKAIARSAGLKALHDEAAEFEHTRGELAHANRRAAGLIAFKGVFLEGVEVCLIVVALGAKSGQLVTAGGAALAALLMVMVMGALVRAPLSRVPENAIKFAVGAMLLSFGTLWTMEALAGAAVWWHGDLSVLLLVAFYLVGGWLAAQLLRRGAGVSAEVKS
ncbi:MAG: COG4280 domain-containing protein [Gammaproteobacteria bacterium]